ncbi:transcriptional regulator [Arthrobacter crystallopoietes BAB-32]|uniref:Transcriptional regulator n=1 Tax=Arthrobacter crystallopoietes BAB-32 TaxID=1246476 RepID=N1UWB0_9MICC|nr:transcriptional regulator [Arthrobacter crystallopoietes BAB-32]
MELAAVKAMPLVLVLPPRLSALPDPVDLTDLADEAWILPTQISGFPGLLELAEQLWRSAGARPASIRSVSTLQTAVPLIAAGMGISLMPRSITDIAGTRVEVRNSLQPVAPLHAVMVWSRQLPPSPVLELFLGVAQRTYTGEL